MIDEALEAGGVKMKVHDIGELTNTEYAAGNMGSSKPYAEWQLKILLPAATVKEA